MKNKKTMGFVALGIVALLGISLVAAYQGDPSVKGPNYSDDRHQAMQEAFTNYDYNAWVALMTEDGRSPGVLNKIDESNFALFVDSHNAAISGDLDKAAELRAELGLGQGMKQGQGNGQSMKGQGMHSGQGSGNAYKGSQGYSRECPYAN